MIKLHILSAIFLSFTLAAFESFASDGNNEAKLLNSEIFSLSKKKEDAFDAPSATYVISSEDIRRSGATSIPETLRLVPGIQVAKNDNNSWSISARGFNSQYSNKLLVMIDGRTVYTTLFSGAFWDTQDYPLEDIERIEVIKGSGGTIWGANAVNGVINIITKTSSLTQGGYVSGLTGNNDNIAEARYGSKTKSNDSYRVYAKKTNRDASTKASDGSSNQDNFRGTYAGFRYDIKSIPESDITVSGDTSEIKSQNYFAALNPYTMEQNDKNSRSANVIVNWNKTLSKKSNFTLQSYLDYNRVDFPTLEISLRTVDFDFQHFYNFSKNNQFIWGLGYRLVQDSIKENPQTNGIIPLKYSESKQNNDTYSAFIQDKIGIIADELYLTLGSKFEHNNYTDFEYQPNARLTYYPSDNQTAWASVSRAIRTPTRAENSLIQSSSTSGVVVQRGTDQFDTEELTAYELGYRIKPTKATLFDIAVFYNDYNNLRTFEKSSPTSPAIANNLARGKSYGTEISAKWQVRRDWRLEVGYDFLKMDIKAQPNSTNTTVYYQNGQSPRNQFNFRSNYNITPKIEFDNMVYYVDSLPLTTSYGVQKPTPIPAYVRFDTRIAYLVEKNLELSLVGQNLTDKRHQEFGGGFYNNQTEVGRTFYAKVVWGF